MPELTYAVAKAVNNNTGNARTRKPNDTLNELDTLLQARAGDKVTKTATENEEGYTRSSTRESNAKKGQHLWRHTC